MALDAAGHRPRVDDAHGDVLPTSQGAHATYVSPPLFWVGRVGAYVRGWRVRRVRRRLQGGGARMQSCPFADAEPVVARALAGHLAKRPPRSRCRHNASRERPSPVTKAGVSAWLGLRAIGCSPKRSPRIVWSGWRNCSDPAASSAPLAYRASDSDVRAHEMAASPTLSPSLLGAGLPTLRRSHAETLPRRRAIDVQGGDNSAAGSGGSSSRTVRSTCCGPIWWPGRISLDDFSSAFLATGVIGKRSPAALKAAAFDENLIGSSIGIGGALNAAPMPTAASAS